MKGGDVILFVLIGALAIWALRDSTVESRENAARDTAKTLGLKSPIINCDPASTLLCGCLISHGPADNRRVESWHCCSGGCD